MKWTMISGTVAAATLTALVTGNILWAEEEGLCDVPEAMWKTPDDLRARLESDGWVVDDIEIGDGCYEAYVTLPDGQSVEAYFNPHTLVRVMAEEVD